MRENEVVPTSQIGELPGKGWPKILKVHFHYSVTDRIVVVVPTKDMPRAFDVHDRMKFRNMNIGDEAFWSFDAGETVILAWKAHDSEGEEPDVDDKLVDGMLFEVVESQDAEGDFYAAPMGRMKPTQSRREFDDM